jgi:alpha-D-xyloside xylohydrolase
MVRFTLDGNAIVWRRGHELLRVEPWGADSARVRCTHEPAVVDFPGALLAPENIGVRVEASEAEAVLVNGNLTVKVAQSGWTRFYRTDTGAVLLEEDPHAFVRDFRSLPGGGLYHLEQRFRAYAGERLFGLGQHTDGVLDQKGCVIELDQRNTQVAIPFLVSSRGYGLLWNLPGVGRVELGANRTRWVAEAAPQIDYWITAGPDPAAILKHYAEATGHSPMLPAFAVGFWQCKLRYRTQDELLAVAREYRRRGLPLSVIVVDYFHWAMMGDWGFDPACWPDPAAMVRELREMGVELMVSVWPTVNPDHPDYSAMVDQGFITRTERGLPAEHCFTDTYAAGRCYIQYYDATHPGARSYLWNKLRENYVRLGIRVFWLDACEPEYNHKDHDHLRYHLGNGQAVGNLYPYCHQQGVFEGLTVEGESDIIMLSRSAWAGSQRWGAAVWSGDIASTFESLRQQVRAGLNMALSGIPWWTTDIGGFHGGDVNDPVFRELIVRWFQYGVFCPLFRLHGVRAPGEAKSGGPNEVWSFGEEAYRLIRNLLLLRERLRPYIMRQMEKAHTEGLPPMRPLFVDFPEDAAAWAVDDQFMFGPDILVAPVLEQGAVQREAYLPAGTRWVEASTGFVSSGGQRLRIHAPLFSVPVFLRESAASDLRPLFTRDHPS